MTITSEETKAMIPKRKEKQDVSVKQQKLMDGTPKS